MLLYGTCLYFAVPFHLILRRHFIRFYGAISSDFAAPFHPILRRLFHSKPFGLYAIVDPRIHSSDFISIFIFIIDGDCIR